LTGEFLEEQHKGTRDLAGKLATLSKMTKSVGTDKYHLAEFLFDKKLLNGEV
jgi:ferritin heavy chain